MRMTSGVNIGPGLVQGRMYHETSTVDLEGRFGQGLAVFAHENQIARFDEPKMHRVWI